MNTQSIAIAALLSSLAFTAAAAPATEGAIGSEPIAQSVKSRADVRQETLAAVTAARRAPLSADDFYIGG